MDEELQRELGEVRAILGYPSSCFEETGMVEGKRRRFGRFMGLKGLESASPSGEGAMRERMERWVAEEMARRERRVREIEMWRCKGY